MGKCADCRKFISAKGGATCGNCSNRFHLVCAHLAETDKVSPNWRCQECKAKRPKNKKTVTTVTGASSGDSEGNSCSPCSTVASFEDAADSNGGKTNHGQENNLPSAMDVGEEMRMIRVEIREMRDELKTEIMEFCREMADLRLSLASCNKRFEELDSRLLALENRANVTPSESSVGQLESKVAQLQLELNDRDQELLASDIEISNLPESSNENVAHTVELVAKKLGVVLETRDIVFAERVGRKGERSGDAGETSDVGAEARGRRIVVRLARQQLRDELLRSARVRRGAMSDDLGLPSPPRRFYINERLTRTNKMLFYHVRQAANRLGWKFAWTKRGRILAKQGDGKRTYSIRSEADLEHVFGCEPAKNNKI